MGNSGGDKPFSRERLDAVAARKQAERERLAAALRANLNRRKAQYRDRRLLDAAGGEQPGGGNGEDRAAKL